MVAFPPCKINLGIHVLGRRADGFHDIETCFYAVPRTDILEVVPADAFSFETSGLSIPGASGENLCVKAYELIKRDYRLPDVHIILHKLIPFGAGLGGGSSDGAWTVRLLNDVCELRLSAEVLSRYAATLGSDCPYFLRSGAQIGTGRGEVLSGVNLSLKGKYIIIVKPDVHISSREAYERVVPGEPSQRVRSIVENVSPEDWKDVLVNQFERHAIETFPVIGFIKQELFTSGAFYASMSGSGSAVYGLFNSELNLRDKFSMYDYWSGWLTE